jgi:hypothetical protein
LTNQVQTIDGQQLLISSQGVCFGEVTSDPVDPKQVEACLRWFKQASPTDTPNINSFWLKHVVENWAGMPISNGALIVAASQAGFVIGRESDSENANVEIGVAVNCINEFDCGCGAW